MTPFLLARWWFLTWAPGWFCLPVTRRVFGRHLPDHGLAAGRIAFLATWTLTAFWLGQIGLPVRLSAELWWGFAVGGAILAWMDRRGLAALLPGRRRAWISGDGVFLAVFLLFFLFRGFWSDTSGTNGEKSMDSALIGTLCRSQHLPPANPYSAGTTLRAYYYLGHLETALLTDAAGTTVRWSYNLMCATLPALCFSTLCALGGAIGGRTRAGLPLAAGVLGLGTLQPLYQWSHPSDSAHWQLCGLNFFDTSRVIPYTINEYPWFTFNQADLHAHYFDIPLELLALTVAWRLFRGGRPWGALIFAPVLLAAQMVTNTWDVPLSMLAMIAAFWLGHLNRSGSLRDSVQANPVPEQLTSWEGAVWTVLLPIAAAALSFPYWHGLHTAASPPKPLPQPASPLGDWLLLWGPWAGAWLLYLVTGRALSSKKDAAGRAKRRLLLLLPAFLLAGWNLAAWLRLGTVYPVLTIILLGAIWSGLMAAFTSGRGRFLCILAGCGFLALLWSETTWAGFLGSAGYAGFDDYKRQDTVFKFGVQAWLLLGSAGCAALGQYPARVKRLLPIALIPIAGVMAISSFVVTCGRTRTLEFDEQGNRHLIRVWQGWDAWAHLAPPEQAAADWLETHTPPGQAIVEASDDGDYSEFGRYTAATGIPEIIGPRAHSFQWAPAHLSDVDQEWQEVFWREKVVQYLYGDGPSALKVSDCRFFGVRYIVCGELEQAIYGAPAIHALEHQFPVVFETGATDDPHRVTILEVR